jgi:hypothetical protein
MQPTVKQLIIDLDREKNIIRNNSYGEITTTVFRDSSYIFQANVVVSPTNSTAIVFDSGDTFYVAAGDKYGDDANPVIIVDSGFNTEGTYNITNGQLSWRMNTTSEALALDLGNSASKTYRMDIWCGNSNSKSVLLSQSALIVKNIVVEP